MLRSVYAVLDRKIAVTALAASVSSLYNPASNAEDTRPCLNSVLCAVVNSLGELYDQYDGFRFVKAVIKAQSGVPTKSTNVAKATARLIFECTLVVTRTIPSLQAALEARTNPSLSNFDMVDAAELEGFRKGMLELRKTILTWCTTYLCLGYKKKITLEEETKCADSSHERGAVILGPGAPNYDSVLDLNSSLEYTDSSSPFHRMMALIRCILFLSHPSSEEMQTFSTMVDDKMDYDRLQRINFCCCYGVDVDDPMIRIVLSSPNVTQITALEMIENLLVRCGSGHASGSIDCNVNTVWEIYKLAEYVPKFRSGGSNSLNGNISDATASNSDAEQMIKKPKLPR